MTPPIIGISTYRKLEGELQSPWYSLPHSYVEAVTVSGGLPLLIPVGLTGDPLRAVFDRLDGLLLSGGGDVHPSLYGAHPGSDLVDLDAHRDRSEIDLALWAAVTGKPLLAICRGLQILNVALGGSLYQDIHREHPGSLEHNLKDLPPDALAHQVSILPESKFSGWIGRSTIDTNSRHHQAIREPAADLEVTAQTSDGIIEAVELPEHPFGIGVQWHPEDLFFDPASRAIFASFIAACDR
jgi:putative glutamine amidotransferase